jgi:hypothetical protein
MTRLRASWEYLRGTYWAVPSAMAVAAVGLSVGMIQLDEAATARLLDRLSWIYAGGPEGARAVLSTVAASMITVAGVTFSITIVALTLASQQFGPRLLRNFLRDLGNQIVLGTFVSTFIYCLLVLRTVRGSDDEEFVPHLAVTVGVVLAMLSLGVLIFFIHHVSTSIQPSRIIANVAEDLESAINRLFPDTIGEDSATADPGGASPDELDAVEEGAHEVRATTTGYVQAIDAQALMDVARAQNVVVRVRSRPGAFVRKGGVLLTVGPTPPHGERNDKPFQRVFIIGSDRTGTQDVTFFIDQLVELAVRPCRRASTIQERRGSASIASSRRSVTWAVDESRHPRDRMMMGVYACSRVPSRSHASWRAPSTRSHGMAGRVSRSPADCSKRWVVSVRVCGAKRTGGHCCGGQRRLPGTFANPHAARATASGSPDAIARPSPPCMSHLTIRPFLRVSGYPASHCLRHGVR